MEFTCLSKGSGFQFPPCHVLDISGFRILFDCPLDLSALAIFSPVPTEYLSPVHDEAESSAHELSDSESVALKRRKIDKPLDASNLVHAEPWYKTVKNLHLWDVSLIDIVLISSPMGMLGLPFLTKSKGFTAKIYATEATTRIGQFMMEDLVSMHMEFKQFYGPDDGFPHWMKWEELEELPPTLREIAIGHDMEELGGWMRLYIAADVKDCMRKVQTLRYSEEACYNGTLILKAFSSGLEIGACNWTINGPRASITCLSGSISVSGHASDFDFHALQGNDMIIYSDFSPLHSTEDVHDDMNLSSPQWR